ncbi:MULTISPECIES: hypothetical protein [Burkholderia]|uniref:hypothetical protein n=1 Tax=Burkholderia TaxID=32008 RepID=UPI0009EEA229|nr:MULTISPECIES: hypothetical protein [Burkholderia]
MNARLRRRVIQRVAARRTAHRTLAIVRVPEVVLAARAHSASANAHDIARRDATLAARLAPLVGGRRARASAVSPPIPFDSSR